MYFIARMMLVAFTLVLFLVLASLVFKFPAIGFYSAIALVLGTSCPTYDARNHRGRRYEFLV